MIDYGNLTHDGFQRYGVTNEVVIPGERLHSFTSSSDNSSVIVPEFKFYRQMSDIRGEIINLRRSRNPESDELTKLLLQYSQMERLKMSIEDSLQ